MKPEPACLPACLDALYLHALYVSDYIKCSFASTSHLMSSITFPVTHEAHTRAQVKADEVCDTVGRSHPAVALHGDIGQAQRERALQQFRWAGSSECSSPACQWATAMPPGVGSSLAVCVPVGKGPAPCDMMPCQPDNLCCAHRFKHTSE